MTTAIQPVVRTANPHDAEDIARLSEQLGYPTNTRQTARRLLQVSGQYAGNWSTERYRNSLLLDCGLRPEEVVRPKWGQLRDNDCLRIPWGKTASAARVVPLSKRTKTMLKRRRNGSEWVFPANTKSGHVEPSSLRKQHFRTCEKAKVARFVFYDLRHTCLTRWASYLDAFTLAYLAGHRDISTTKRYVHPQPETVRKALERARRK
jgi:integrase